MIIVFYKKLSNQLELEAIKQHNGILLEIKNKLDEQDRKIKHLFEELKLDTFDTTPALFKDDAQDEKLLKETKSL